MFKYRMHSIRPSYNSENHFTSKQGYSSSNYIKPYTCNFIMSPTKGEGDMFLVQIPLAFASA